MLSTTKLEILPNELVLCLVSANAKHATVQCRSLSFVRRHFILPINTLFKEIYEIILQIPSPEVCMDAHVFL